jgi:transposase InsO family protein
MRDEIARMIDAMSDSELVIWGRIGGELPRRKRELIRAMIRAARLAELRPPEPAPSPPTVWIGKTVESPVMVYGERYGQRFASQTEAAKSLGVRRSAVNNALKRGKPNPR